MGKFLDLTGLTFGRLRVLGVAGRDAANKITWNCVCECGNSKLGITQYLKNGMTDSCGCRRTEQRIEQSTSHGMRSTITYRSWSAMKTRCTNPNVESYKNYGGRGIKICERWNDFANFLADMGERPSLAHSLDRENTNGDYEPGNCRWATRVVQSNNSRANVRLKHDGMNLTLAEWSRITRIDMRTLSGRLANGWSPAEILTLKPRYGLKRIPQKKRADGTFARRDERL